jgi:hypothetical protein
LIICNRGRQILYVSKSYRGKEHDYDLLKQEFPPSIPWFEDLTVRLDLGFQGFGDLYPCKSIYLPIKRKRVAKGLSNELSTEQREYNKELGKERIYVEHSIGGMKRYRILEYRNRLKSRKVIDQVIGVCAGLWNLLLNP